MGRRFDCHQCGGNFESDWTDEEARAEHMENFGKEIEEIQDVVLVCDDCYDKIREKTQNFSRF